MRIIGLYSFVIVAVFFWFVSVFIAWRWLSLPVGILLVVIVGGGILALGLALRHRSTVSPNANAGTLLDESIGKGKPVFIMVYSNF